jgi:dTDP-4-dehydrorhamnose 3,5-epimerase
MAEGKLVRCTTGAALDVIIDLRKESPTYCRWDGAEISAENRLAVYVPPGVAHGFQTLVDGTELYYQMTEYFAPQLADGVRWNDPAFGVVWPIPDPILSPRDASYADFSV